MATLTSKLILSLIDRVTQPAKSIEGRVARLNDSINATERQMSAARGKMIGATAGLVAFGAALVNPVRHAIAMETAMANIEKVSTLSTEQLAATRDRIDELSNSMPLARTEIAELIASAAQFGIANEDLEQFALLGAKAAVAFGMGPGAASQSLSELKNAFDLDISGLTALADAINYTADTAGTSESKVIDFLLRTGATAKTFGISAQQMSAFGATLNEIGIDSAKAGTGMNAMINKVANLTANKKAVKFLDSLRGEGYSARLQKKFYDEPVKALQEIFAVSKEMSAEQRSGFFLQMFGLEYGDDASAIVENIDKINERLAEMSDETRAAGSVQNTYEIFSETTAGKMQTFRNQLVGLSTTIGDTLLPRINELMEKLGPVVTRFADWAEANRGFVQRAIEIAGGLLAIRVVATSARFLMLVGKLGVLTLAAQGLAAIAAVVGFAPVALGVALVAGAAALLWQNWEKVGPYVTAAWNELTAFADAAPGIVERITNPFETLYEDLRGLLDGMKEEFAKLLEWARSVPGKIKATIGDINPFKGGPDVPGAGPGLREGMIQPGSFSVPRPTRPEWSSSAAGGARMTNINVGDIHVTRANASGEDIARALGDELRRVTNSQFSDGALA